MASDLCRNRTPTHSTLSRAVGVYFEEITSSRRVTEANHYMYIGHGVIGRVTYL
jgi:hypothetical protein